MRRRGLLEWGGGGGGGGEKGHPSFPSSPASPKGRSPVRVNELWSGEGLGDRRKGEEEKILSRWGGGDRKVGLMRTSSRQPG